MEANRDRRGTGDKVARVLRHVLPLIARLKQEQEIIADTNDRVEAQGRLGNE